ncbi:MAG: SpoIIE family protein phosphatase [Thermoanaerobaculia bacterium]|nr:SpoIIE family protein phosphatase [Thermoanaerobaculia bacterium]
MNPVPEERPDEATLVRNMNSLLEVSKALGAEARLDSLLGVIVRKATEVMEAERSSIFIYDEVSDALSIRVSEDLAQGQIRIPVGVGIAGHVARTREPLNVPDAYADPRFNPKFDRDTGYRTRSILCAPALTNDGRLIGVIQVLNKVGHATFTASDERLLAAFASIAGIALDRARLVEAFLEKEKIESSLRLAYEIQMGMLPTRFPERPELDVFGTLRPAKTVGGDLYDFRLDGDRLWFVVGDVSGKGVPAALFMAVTKVLFGASVEVETSPAAVMARVNRALCRENGQSLFVSAFLGRLDVATGELEYANAGHNRPYLLGKDGAVSALAAGTSLVLAVNEDFEYRTERVRLDPGDGVFLFTDGVTEAINERDELFSESRLEAYLASANGRSATDLVEGAVRALDAFAGRAPQFDDITALSIRFRAG